MILIDKFEEDYYRSFTYYVITENGSACRIAVSKFTLSSKSNTPEMI